MVCIDINLILSLDAIKRKNKLQTNFVCPKKYPNKGVKNVKFLL